MMVENELTCPCCERFGRENASPQVPLSQLSCGCHSCTSPAFFTHDTTVSAGCLWPAVRGSTKALETKTLLQRVECMYYKHIPLYVRS